MATVLNRLKLQSAVFGVVDKSSLPPAATDAEIDAEIRRDWNDSEVQDLVKLAHALGVGKIILLDRYIDGDLGEYFCARDRNSHSKLEPWSLAPKQRTTLNRVLSSGRDVILISHNSSGDFAATLAHEIGHYINRRLGGLNHFRFFPVTEKMRRVARFNQGCYLNKDEYYAEIWSRYLRGDAKRTRLRYLDTHLSRMRKDHPAKTRLIEDYRKRVCKR